MIKRPNFLVILIIILILIHGFLDKYFKIDNITILLVIIILVIPYFPLVKRIRFGDFEAEITQKEIESAKQKVDNVKIDNTKGINRYSELEKIAQIDLKLSLAKVRIEIEKKVKSLTLIYVDSLPERLMKRISLRGMIHELLVRNIIDKDFEQALIEITDIATRAVHGEEINEDNKEVLMKTAIELLRKLDSLLVNSSLKQLKVQEISAKDLFNYENSEYLLTTVVPYVKKPEKRTYSLSQAELSAFLNSYQEEAEFIIELKKLKKVTKKL